MEETEIQTLSRRLRNNSELILNADMRERVLLNLIDIAEKLKVGKPEQTKQPEESKESQDNLLNTLFMLAEAGTSKEGLLERFTITRK